VDCWDLIYMNGLFLYDSNFVRIDWVPHYFYKHLMAFRFVKIEFMMPGKRDIL